MLVYYTSQTFKGAEERYPKAEKMAFALFIMARQLRPYFQDILSEYSLINRSGSYCINLRP